ncbi:MAG: hypothetical protein ACLUR5_07630 [Eubacterium ventriosum]
MLSVSRQHNDYNWSGQRIRKTEQQRQMESPSQPQHVIIMKEVYYYTQRMIMVKRQARTS